MFFVFNKDKAISYIVTVFTIVILFLTASILKKPKESVPTSVNEIIINNIKNSIIGENLIDNNEIINNY